MAKKILSVFLSIVIAAQLFVIGASAKNGKYIMGINDHMHYSKSAIYRIHGEALKNIVIPKEWSKLE